MCCASMVSAAALSTMPEPVVIIGAGAAGLATARELKKRRMEYRVLERGSTPGQTWADLYDSLRLHTGRHMSALPGMRLPRGTPLFPSRTDFHEYLREYARRHDIAVETGRNVHRVRRDARRWIVYADGEEIEAGAIVAATGIVANPFVPPFAGREDFERAGGRVLHSAEYRRPDSFAGRRVLVVGVGNSGGEIASELARAGVDVTVAVRSGANVVPLTLAGVPIQYLSTIVRRLPRPAREKIVEAVQRISEHRRGPPVLPVPAHSPLDAIPLIGFNLIDEIRAGRVRVRPGIDAFTRTGAGFSDGTTHDFDDVILATGFRPALSIFGDAIRRDVRGLAVRLDRVRSADYEDLVFVGQNYDSRGGLLNIAADAPLAAQHIARTLQRLHSRDHRHHTTRDIDVTERRPFIPLLPVRRTLTQRLLRRRPRENAVVEINNLLACADSVRDVTREDVLRICEEHRTTLGGPLAGRFERIYRDYLACCLEDRHLSSDELADLAWLQKLLDIPAPATAAIHEHVSRQLYRCSVAEMLNDGVIDAGEREFLGRLQQELAISGRAAHRIMEEKMKQRQRPSL